jgi:hypothetical protein
MRTSICILAAIISLPAVAVAGPLPSGETHEPPVFTVPSADFFQLSNNGDDGYSIYNAYWMLGAGSASDRVRAEAVQGGKVLAKDDCTVKLKEEVKGIYGACRVSKLKAKGVVEIRLIFTDDATDKEYLVNTWPLTIRTWKGNGDRYAYLPDDALALAYFHHENDDGGSFNHKPIFDFWTTEQYLAAKKAAFRCTVDGKKIPDIAASISNHTLSKGDDLISARHLDGKTDVTYNYSHVGAEMAATWGPLPENKFQPALIENPGKWECNLRVEGKVLRIFTFTVNKDGMVEPSELQKTAKRWRTFPGQALVDMKIPKDAAFELRMRNDAMKKSAGFGTPWPDSPKAKEAQAALPPTMGLPD